MDSNQDLYGDIKVNGTTLELIMSLPQDKLLAFSTKCFLDDNQQKILKVNISDLINELNHRANEFRRKYYVELDLNKNNPVLFNLTIEYYRDVLVPEFRQSQTKLINSVELTN